jgi:hypothetical protein
MKKTFQSQSSPFRTTLLGNCLLLLLLTISWIGSAQTTVQVGAGTNNAQYVPIAAYYNYSYSQTIYTAADITAAGGFQGLISKIRYMRNSGNMGANDAGWTIYMGHTTASEFASNTAWIPVAQLTQVYSGTITYAGTGAWTEVTLTAPFSWNGTDNIVVAIDENAGGYGGGSTSSFTSTNNAQNRAIYYYSDNTNPDPTGPPSASGRLTGAPNVQFNLLPPCAGAPNPGNTLASPSAVCTGQSSTLSLQNNYLNFSGITYQWQKFDGTSWVNIASATSATYTATNITADTDYRCKVLCGTEEGISTLVTITVNSLPVVSVSPATAITCASEGVTLTATGADTYSWTPNTNLTPTTGAVVVSTAAAVLTYTVTGTITASGCQNIATTTVTPITALPITVVSTPAVACTQGTPITLNGTVPSFIPGGGQIEYQWLDSAGTNVLEDWTTTGYTFTPANIGTYRFNVKARISTCPANVSPTRPYSISVGFDGDVVVTDVYCGQTTGSINVTNALGPLTSGIWYENTFSTANLDPTQIELFGNSSAISGGKLILTPNIGSRNGGAVIYNPAGINPKSMELTFDLTVGGGPSNTNGADGMSWSFGPDVVGIPAGTSVDGINTQNAEHGSGSGLKIGFDAYDSNFPNKAGIYLMYNCTTFNKQANSPGVIQYLDNLTWKGTTKNVIITIDDLGRLTMKFGTTVIFNNVQLPAAFVNADKSTWKHAFSARTGGVSMNHEIDNIKISYTKTDVAYGIAAVGALPTTWQPGSSFTGLAIDSYDVYVASGANPAGCNKLLGTFAVNDSITPAPGNTYTSLSTICANTNATVNLTLQDTYSAYPGITYQWQSFDGTDWVNINGATNPSYSFSGLAATTDFRAKVSCDTTMTGISNLVTVVSVAPPAVAVTPSAISLCEGEIPTLTATGADTYVWTGTGLSATTGSSVTATVTSYQQYTVTGTETGTGCSNSTSAYVTPIEDLPVTADVIPTSICASGSPVTLKATSIPVAVAGAGTWEFQWLDSTNTVIQDWSADSIYTFTPATDGYYSFSLKMRSTACDSMPQAKNIGFYVGFGGEASTIDINCYIPTGTISVYDYFGQGNAGSWYANNFSSTTLVATEATLHQTASITAGRVQLTPSTGSLRGGFTVLNPAGIVGTNVEYNITFKMTADQPSGTFGTGGADGIAYSFGPDANYSNTTGNPCSGFGSKLRVVFDANDNQDFANNQNVRGIYVTYGYNGNGQVGPALATTLAHSPNIASWKLKTDAPITINISTDGKLTLTVDGTVIFSNIQLPAEFQSSDKSTWKHVFSAQTGGDAMRQAIDDVNISYSALAFGATPAGSPTLPTWQQSSTITGLTAGDYDVYVASFGNESCNKKIGTYSIIDRNPHVDFPSDTTLCAGQTLVLDAGNVGSYYAWNTGEIGTDEQFYTVTAQGTYIVEVTDTIGCETVGIINVTAGANPIVNLGADVSICNGATVTLDAGSDGTTYLWSDNSGDPTLDVTAAGNYSVTVTNDDGCSGTDNINVTVLSAPTLAGLGTQVNGITVSFTAQTPQNASTYTWNFGDGNTITTTTPTINYNYALCGTYNITVTAENAANCGIATKTASVTLVCAGIEEMDANGGLNVYPNPAADFIAIANPNGLTIDKVTIYDASGKQVFQSSNSVSLVPDITSWKSGMYLVKVDAEGKTFVQRIIIGR